MQFDGHGLPPEARGLRLRRFLSIFETVNLLMLSNTLLSMTG
jgi:hypothetical protein